MRTAIDTNILSALLSSEGSAHECAVLLDSAAEQGGLVICGIVYAELLAHPQMTSTKLNTFLSDSGIDVDFDFDEALFRATASAYSAYCRRRRRSEGGPSKQLLADFLIGAHAINRANVLYTLDPARYRQAYPKLRLRGLGQ